MTSPACKLGKRKPGKAFMNFNNIKGILIVAPVDPPRIAQGGQIHPHPAAGAIFKQQSRKSVFNRHITFVQVLYISDPDLLLVSRFGLLPAHMRYKPVKIDFKVVYIIFRNDLYYFICYIFAHLVQGKIQYVGIAKQLGLPVFIGQDPVGMLSQQG